MTAVLGESKQSHGADVAPPGVNEVRLRGRISAGPQGRELPSGAVIVTFRLVVRREATVMTKGSRQPSDWVECSAWSASDRRRVGRWAEGDLVEVTGALRRRHYRTAVGSSSIVEIEVLGGRRVKRSAQGRAVRP